MSGETPSIRFYNTLTRKKDSLPAVTKEKPLKLFVCGLTVYDYAHIGNARTYLIFDALVKYLRSQHIPVFYLQNITDIDDKILLRAEEENVNWRLISRRYWKIFQKNLKDLQITAVDKYAPATSFIKEIVSQVETLAEKGFVYQIPGDGYYFDIGKAPHYGELARRTLEQAEDGTSRIDASVHKKNKGDFCVWKFSEKNQPGWKSSLGFGRPGWHIEDTAVSFDYFGSQYDLHGGALDLQFPHHEAEIALAEALSGKRPFVKLWMHSGFLLVGSKKMSKSLKNFITIEDFLKKYSASVFRLLVLSHHYRMPLNFTWELAESYAHRLEALETFVWKLDFIAKSSYLPPKSVEEGKHLSGETIAASLRTTFFKKLADDFNTPEALATLQSFYDEEKGAKVKAIWNFSHEEAALLRATVVELLSVLGLKMRTLRIPARVKSLLKQRDLSRKRQQFVQADELREEIYSLGYRIDDTPLGPFVFPSS